MPLFLIVPQPSPSSSRLGTAIHGTYPGNVHDLEGGAGWLVVANASAEEVSGKIGITDGVSGAGVVVQVSTYFGRANANTWAWISANWGRVNV